MQEPSTLAETILNFSRAPLESRIGAFHFLLPQRIRPFYARHHFMIGALGLLVTQFRMILVRSFCQMF
jgi:hypothetical protein